MSNKFPQPWTVAQLRALLADYPGELECWLENDDGAYVALEHVEQCHIENDDGAGSKKSVVFGGSQ